MLSRKDKPRPRGRPSLIGKVRRMVILTESLEAKARRLGKGKLSPGVRDCIERAKEKSRPEDAPSEICQPSEIIFECESSSLHAEGLSVMIDDTQALLDAWRLARERLQSLHAKEIDGESKT